ncbi:triphosphoribosyl-dephospho-CoA synthase [Acerihabitans arboris]|uniref:2-(5''-triphosphoribosyl)-3'-dephosphocoenzyme-A synthase n=1 Tax=Acerihabitans arboris TaxID=2691583 RepID=A0A845SNE9_9GAMM|nr:triphosphoribosyl-dephospho-CoA synthase [Acerihabitans arboris]NDL64454.1 triphosphoribosyl-dephospho-CoA synthase [Acerihabitans arboris]
MKAQSLTLPNDAEAWADNLSTLAVSSLIEEARLSPKPGLVDSRGPGAHQDLSLALMERSARSLRPTFYRLALHSWQRPPDMALRQEIGRLGRQGEQHMMNATGGVNTHRGAIWALGLLASASAMLGGRGTVAAIAAHAARLAVLPDPSQPKIFSKGQRATQRYQVPGAREEAIGGFPHVTLRALPQLRRSRLAGAGESEARLDALMAIMATLTDTCVLNRGGMAALTAMHHGAAAVLTAGGTGCPAGRAALAALELRMLADNASPGGAADLLAATFFLDWASARPSTSSRGCYGTN